MEGRAEPGSVTAGVIVSFHCWAPDDISPVHGVVMLADKLGKEDPVVSCNLWGLGRWPEAEGCWS